MTHTRKQRYESLLPIQTGPTTVISGFICDDYMTADKGRWPYNECCQNPTNWEGRGEWHPLSTEEATGLTDPWYWKGYRQFRDVWCKECGVRVIATEYRPGEPGDGA
jgi:hypothetical protein